MVFSEIDRSRIDDCLYYLLEANETYKGIVEIHPYDALFESEEGKEAEEHNVEVTSKTVSSLHKAVVALKKIIKNIMESIKNFIQELCMSGEEHKRYEMYKKALSENPELKNVKVTVKDFRAIEKHYDAMINEVSAKIKEVSGGKNTDIEKFMGEMSKALKDNSAEIAKVMTLDAAMNAAANYKIVAQGINKILQENDEALDKLEKTLGEKTAKKYAKKIDIFANSKELSLRRLLANIGQKKANSLADCVKNTTNNVSSLLKGKTTKSNQIIADGIKGNHVTKDSIAGDTMKTYVADGIKEHIQREVKENITQPIKDAKSKLSTKITGKNINRSVRIF